MPAKKRTDNTKRTSTSPSTSTSHATGDHPHRLRHTGPSIGTQSAAPAKPLAAHDHADPASESMPAGENAREKKSITPAPSGTPFFTKFLYVLLATVLLLSGWYIYGMVILLDRLKEEVGWWGILVGDSGGMTTTCERCAAEWSAGGGKAAGGTEGAGKGGGLEEGLNALADALGISPMEVAYAVKPVIPQPSLTSMASDSAYTGSRSEAVRVLFQDDV